MFFLIICIANYIIRYSDKENYDKTGIEKIINALNKRENQFISDLWNTISIDLYYNITRGILDSNIKKERAARLRKLAGVKNLAFRKQCLDREFTGIVVKREKDHTQALTDNYIEVRVPSSRIQERSEVEIRITRVTPKLTEGKIIRT